MTYLEIAEETTANQNAMAKAKSIEAELKRLYQDSIRKFSDNWLAGTYGRLDKENPGLMRQINASRNALDKVWIDVRQGTAGLPDFRAALSEWERLHLIALDHK